MAKPSRIRSRGAIPERQHDAFLLALLLAILINGAGFALQAILPKIALLLRLLGPQPAAMRQEEEATYPFVLVDPSLLTEEVDPDQLTEAESTVDRRARQTEATPNLPDELAYRDEGLDQILTAQEGNPGPGESSLQAPGDASAPPSPDQADSPEQSENPDESPPVEPEQPAEPVEPAPPAEPAAPEPPPEPMPDPPAEPAQPSEAIEQPPEAPETPEPPAPETPSEPPPEPPEERPDLPEPAAELQEPEAEERPDTSPQVIDLAALPLSADGIFSPESSTREERLYRRPESPPRQLQTTSPTPREQPLERRTVQPSDQANAQTAAPGRPRSQPTFKRIGGGSVAGGAPPRRNTSSGVRLLDSDANMALLASRYGEYMAKVARQLQASLNREMVLNPTGYTSGQVKIRFGISPDGRITFQETMFPSDGSLPAERMMSERMLREAGPFDPFPPNMMRDVELFQKLTVVVNLYM